MLKCVYYTSMQKQPQANYFSRWFLFEHYVWGRLQTFSKNTAANETHGHNTCVPLTGNLHKIFIILTRGWELNYIRLVISFTRVEMSLQVSIYRCIIWPLYLGHIIWRTNINLVKPIDANHERMRMHILWQLPLIFNARCMV